MKKVLLTIIVILIIITCAYYGYGSYRNNNLTKEEYKPVKIKEEEPIENKYIDNNPIKLGLYKYYGHGTNRKLISEFDNTWAFHIDISSFEVFFTNEQEIPGNNFQSRFKNYYDTYENINDYRIGYKIEFTTSDGKVINKTLLTPKDSDEFFDYLEIYLYDDYHRTPGVWYSHTTESEWNEETLLTSIKLCAGKNIDLINSDIKVTTFSYIKSDLDANNNYIGNSKYTITVKKTI